MAWYCCVLCQDAASVAAAVRGPSVLSRHPVFFMISENRSWSEDALQFLEEKFLIFLSGGLDKNTPDLL
jgi:hypothetical protein